MSGTHQTYGRLVNDDGDMVGHVAYALYKRDKLNFITAIRADKRPQPEDAELSAFIVSANLELRIDAYRSEAEQALQVFSQEVLAGALADVQAGFDRRLADELLKARSWWRAVGENLVANLLAVAVVALFALLLYGTRIGFINLAAEALGYQLVPKTAGR